MSQPDTVGTALVGIVQGLVDHPEQVEVKPQRRGECTVFVLQVAPSDVGQVIGRQGRTARALRALLDARGLEDQRSYDLEIER